MSEDASKAKLTCQGHIPTTSLASFKKSKKLIRRCWISLVPNNAVKGNLTLSGGIMDKR